MFTQQDDDASFRISAGLKRETTLQELCLVEREAAQEMKLNRTGWFVVRPSPMRRFGRVRHADWFPGAKTRVSAGISTLAGACGHRKI
jgi:hypothetical protein